MTNSKNSKFEYAQLCAEKYIPIHGQPWWLDAVCGSENWDVVLAYDKGGNVVGALPFTKSRRFGLDMIRMPTLTSFLPVFLDYPEGGKQHNRTAFETSVLKDLINQLPKTLIFDQNYHPNLTNWLPFFWKKYRQTTRYTYVFDDLSDLDNLYEKFNRNTRRNIRKAEESDIEILGSDDLKSFYETVQITFRRQNLKTPFSFENLSRLDEVLKTRNQRKIYLARDSKNNVHAAGYFIFDRSPDIPVRKQELHFSGQECPGYGEISGRKAYYLASGINTNFRESGAHHLLIWTALKAFSGKVESFDFEGTMLKSVEAVFRGFGARQVPYFRIIKVGNKVLDFGLRVMGRFS